MSGTVMMCKHTVGNSTATSSPSMSMASSWDLALKPWSRAKPMTSSRVDARRLPIMRASLARDGELARGSLPSSNSRLKSPRLGTFTTRGACCLKGAST